MLKDDCVNLAGCLKYLEMTGDPESEVIHCDDCKAYLTCTKGEAEK